MHPLRHVFGLIVLALLAGPAQAQESGLGFLRIGTNAAALAMGDAQVAASRDAFSTYWNPAGLSAAGGNLVAASHRIWIGDLRTYDVAARFSVGTKAGLGLAVTAVDSGDLDLIEQPGVPAGTFRAQFVSIGVSFGRRFGPLHAGATAKYLSERIFDDTASGYGIDLGVQADFLDEGVWIGAALQNIGSMNELAVEETELPRTLRVGAAVYPFHVAAADGERLLDLSLAAEVEHLFTGTVTRFHGGAAVEVMDLIVLRGGYVTDDALRELTFGGGLRFSGLHFDYAFLPFQSGFGTGHVLTMQYQW